MTRRALFFFFKNVHAPILLPIWREMQKRGGYDIAFCVHPYNREIRAGFPPEEEEAFRKSLPGVTFVEHPADWKPDISFMADNVALLLKDCGVIVNVGHGLLSKGQYFTDRDIIQRENSSDLLCVPGPYHRDRLLASGKVQIPVVATGFPKLDALFMSRTLPREELFRRAGLDPAKKAILFAPTFNMELSAIPILWLRVAELVAPDRYLLIKLHGSTLPEFKQEYRKLAQHLDQVHYIEDQDITPWLLPADVLLTDVSSVMMEYIALDKPVVLFNNPNTETYVNYDPRDIEYAWRDQVGLQADTLDGVKEAVRRSLENPGELSASRMQCVAQLLADREGRASANVLDAVEEVMTRQAHTRPNAPVKPLTSPQEPSSSIRGAISDMAETNRADHRHTPSAPPAGTVAASDVAGRIRMTRHFADRGKPDKAREHLAKAEALAPDHPDVKALAARLAGSIETS